MQVLKTPTPYVLAQRPSLQRRSLVVRSEKQGKVLREFREGDDEVKGPSGGAMYVDEQPRARPQQASNLSPEMKARLKAEYTGWGGSPNKAMSNNYFLVVMGVVAGLAILLWLTGAL